jgi:hypothetical protein
MHKQDCFQGKGRTYSCFEPLLEITVEASDMELSYRRTSKGSSPMPLM